jgi:hypothetical protein
MILLMLPPVLWATLVMAITIGFIVAISSNFAAAFAATYGFASWQSGLCFISSVIGSLVGILGGGYVSDLTANFFTARNGGIREPEMRLPAIELGLITAPLSLVLDGVGINNRLHWIMPTLGLGFCKWTPPWTFQPKPPTNSSDSGSEFCHCPSYQRQLHLYHRCIPACRGGGHGEPVEFQV